VFDFDFDFDYDYYDDDQGRPMRAETLFCLSLAHCG